MVDQPWDEAACRSYADGMRAIVKRDHRPWADLIAKRLPAGTRSPTVVELAAGPGFLLLELGKLVPGARLLAVDDAEGMLKIQAQEARAAGQELQSVLGKAQATGLPDGSADVVLCKNLLNCMTEPKEREQVLREAHRLLRPAGLAAFIDFDDAGPKLVAEALTLYVQWCSGPRFARDFAEAWRRRLHAPDIVRMAQRAGLDDVWYHRRALTFLIEGRRAA